MRCGLETHLILPLRSGLQPECLVPLSLSTEKGSPIKPSDPQHTVDIEGLEAEDLEYNYDQKGLAELRRRMKDAVANYQGRGGASGPVWACLPLSLSSIIATEAP